MRLLALVAITGSMTLFAACSSETTNEATGTGGTDGGGGSATGGASTGGASTGGTGAAGDAGADADAGLECPSGMVAMPAGFCIDANEVTNGAYQDWLDNTGTIQLPPPCEWDKDLHPATAGACANRNINTTGPVTCVDWCDASAYCKDQKKHLCGQRDGGPVELANHDDPALDEWHFACTNGGTTLYPYGDTHVAGTCADGAGMPVNTTLKPECHGSVFSQLLHMSGNAAEWVNSCVKGASDEADLCLVRGGSTGLKSPVAPETFSCAGTPGPDGGEPGDLKMRNEASPLIGFRCCKDPSFDPR